MRINTVTIQSISKLGKVVEGHVLDVNKKHFLEKLQQYDPLLYVKWNSEKNQGNGCWEIRRRPSKLTPIYEGEWQGQKLFRLEYVEQDLIHHVLDVQFLNYNVLNKLKEMDTWTSKTWVEDLDYEAERLKDKQETREREHWRSVIRDNRKYFKDLQEQVKSGYDPFSFFRGVKGRKY